MPKKKEKLCPRCNRLSAEFVETLWRGQNGMRRYMLCPKCNQELTKVFVPEKNKPGE